MNSRLGLANTNHLSKKSEQAQQKLFQGAGEMVHPHVLYSPVLKVSIIFI